MCCRCVFSAARVSARGWRIGLHTATATAARVQEWAKRRETAFHLAPALSSLLLSHPPSFLPSFLSSGRSFPVALPPTIAPASTSRGRFPSRSHADRKRQGALTRPAPGPGVQRSSPSPIARGGWRARGFFSCPPPARTHAHRSAPPSPSSSRRSLDRFDFRIFK